MAIHVADAMRGALRTAIAVAGICLGSVIANTIRDGDPDPRVRVSNCLRWALLNLRIGVGCSLERPAERAAWNFKTEDEVRNETAIAPSSTSPCHVRMFDAQVHRGSSSIQ
jgi:hypothetical protein